MKTANICILSAFIFLIVSGVHVSEAVVAVVESRQLQKDEIVTGTYEGYKNQMVYMLLKDGIRRDYPFKSGKSFLRQIAKTPLSTRVTITVEKGVVVGFEEVSK